MSPEARHSEDAQWIFDEEEDDVLAVGLFWVIASFIPWEMMADNKV